MNHIIVFWCKVSISIHQRHLRFLMTEIYKSISQINPEFMQSYFNQKELSCNLRKELPVNLGKESGFFLLGDRGSPITLAENLLIPRTRKNSPNRLPCKNFWTFCKYFAIYTCEGIFQTGGPAIQTWIHIFKICDHTFEF